jgi:hypothetical protein
MHGRRLRRGRAPRKGPKGMRPGPGRRPLGPARPLRAQQVPDFKDGSRWRLSLEKPDDKGARAKSSGWATTG